MKVRYPICEVIDDAGVSHPVYVEAEVSPGTTSLGEVIAHEGFSWLQGAKNSETAVVYAEGRAFVRSDWGVNTFYDAEGNVIENPLPGTTGQG